MKILILNGPSLNLLGTREPEIYGDVRFESYLEVLREEFSQHEIAYFQSNHEGELIDAVQRGGVDAIVLNAGGYTHTSVALRDAVASVQTPVVEVHISNPQAREEFRHVSLLAGVVRGSIAGFGLDSYKIAILAL